MGKRVQAPPSPDYSALATAQGAANVDAARVSGRMSNPNIVTPYGTQTVTWGQGGGSQPGSWGGSTAAEIYGHIPGQSSSGWTYQLSGPGGISTVNVPYAPEQYRQLLQGTGLSISGTPTQSSSPINIQKFSGEFWKDPALNELLQAGGQISTMGGQWIRPYQHQGGWAVDVPGAPEPLGLDRFGQTWTPGQTIPGDPDQPTITQTLTPAGQATVNEQQNAELNLARIANAIVSNESPTGFKQTLLSPFSFSGPPTQTSFRGTDVPVSFAGSPPAQVFGANPGSVRNAPNLEGYGMAQGAANNQPAVAGLQAPRLQMNIDPVTGLTNSLNESGIAGMPVNAGTTAQQAILSRLDPQVSRERTSFETKLTNQGLRPGMEAWDNAMRIFNEGVNDRQIQAALQGLNMDFAANQQGFGQAATRGAFQNQAQQQAFNQRVQSGEFGNAAQLASFGAGLQNIDQINRAAAQNFGQNLQSQESLNAAIAQRQQAALAEQQAANQAQAQQFGNAQQVQAAQNAATQQNYLNSVNYQQNMNAAQQQQFNQRLQEAQFGNAAQQQALAQALQLRQLPFNEISALMSGSQIQNPQFQAFQGQTVAPAPVMQGGQLQGQWDMNRYNQEVAQRNALMSGLFGLGGAAAGMFGFGGGR